MMLLFVPNIGSAGLFSGKCEIKYLEYVKNGWDSNITDKVTQHLDLPTTRDQRSDSGNGESAHKCKELGLYIAKNYSALWNAPNELGNKSSFQNPIYIRWSFTEYITSFEGDANANTDQCIKTLSLNQHIPAMNDKYIFDDNCNRL